MKSVLEGGALRRLWVNNPLSSTGPRRLRVAATGWDCRRPNNMADWTYPFM